MASHIMVNRTRKRICILKSWVDGTATRQDSLCPCASINPLKLTTNSLAAGVAGVNQRHNASYTLYIYHSMMQTDMFDSSIKYF